MSSSNVSKNSSPRGDLEGAFTLGRLGGAILLHTSGSTGSPKPIWVEKSRMIASARITCNFLELQRGCTALLCLSEEYIAGKMMVVRSEEWGMKLYRQKPSNHPLKDFMQTNGKGIHIDFCAMVPSQVYCSLQNEEEREALMDIGNLIIGGGAVSKELANELNSFPNAVWSTYGMTETLSHIALRRLSGSEATDYYTPFDGVSLSVDTDNCLIINAPAVCAETLHTNDVIEFHPADAHLPADARKRFRILGRRDNVICCGGIKLQIEEIERTLEEHLSMPFAIAKRSDDKFGEIPVLVVEDAALSSKESTAFSSKEYAEKKERLTAICKSLLPKYSQPKDILFISQLPLTETGKICRWKLNS